MGILENKYSGEENDNGNPEEGRIGLEETEYLLAIIDMADGSPELRTKSLGSGTGIRGKAGVLVQRKSHVEIS